MAYIDLDHIVITDVIVAPDTRQDCISRQHLSRMHHKKLQQVKLARRQLNDPTIAVDYAGATIERHSLKRQLFTKLQATPAQHCTYPCHQLLECKWLGHIIIGPNIQTSHAI